MQIGSKTIVATGVSLLFLVGGVAALPAQAQEPAQTTPAVPKDSPQKGPEFPAPTLKAPTPTKQVAPPAPGKVTPDTLPQPLTLAAAIDYALRLQPDIASAQASREASEQRLKAQQSSYYPFVTPSYTYQNRYTGGGQTTQFVNGVPITLNRNTTTDTKQGNITASYTVFDSFNRELSNKQARQSLRTSKFGEENTRQSVIADVATNYFQVLRTNALVTVSESQVARAQNTLDVIRAQVDAGVSPRKDTYQAEADLLNAQVSLLQARNNAAVAQAQLKQTIGLVGGDPLQLAAVAEPTEQTPVTALDTAEAANTAPTTTTEDVALKRLFELAQSLRPDIAQARSNVETSKTGVQLARVNNGLQTNINVSDGYQITPEGNGNFGSTQNRQLNLNMSYPLFDGGLTRAQVRQAQADVRNSEASRTGTEQAAAVEVEQNWRNLVVAQATLPSARSAVQAAQINYDAAIASRREGVGSIVEVIQAQTSLVQAQQSLVQATYDFYSADARLARSVGRADRIGTVGSTGTTTPATPAAPGGTPVAPGETPATPVGTPETPTAPAGTP